MQEKADRSPMDGRGCREPARGSHHPGFPRLCSRYGVTDAKMVRLQLRGGIFRVKTRRM